jgi:DNA helicase-2/ATP-dependent DNA helicase PcrA
MLIAECRANCYLLIALFLPHNANTDTILAHKFAPNPKQQQAIEHVAGPMLVLAGAGTGKTSVLVERIARLIEQQHARPDEILAITFTENAAHEMKERVERRLGRKTAITAATFNAYCQAVLRRSGRDFHVLTPEDIYVFLRQRIGYLGLERFIRPSDLGEFLYDLRVFFDRCHEELVEPEQFQDYVDFLQPSPELPRNCKSKDVDELGAAEILARWHEIARVYTNTMRMLEEEGLGTFGMQISRAVRLLQSDAELLRQERARARFLLIDEFQDCNSSNIILADLLAGEEKNIFAVGDPDQAIYRFRGASSAAFEEFQRRFPQTLGVTLDENQRSRGNVLRVAFSAINLNPAVRSESHINFQRVLLQSGRDHRDAQQGRLVFDEPVEIAITPSDDEEAAEIVRQIVSLRQGRTPAGSMAVLYRSHAHREKIMARLAAQEIPFIVKGLDILNTPAVRDLLALAHAVANEADAGSLFRVGAFPRFGMEAAELRQKLAAAAHESTFRSVLDSLDAGRRVLAAVQVAREFIAGKQLRVARALEYLSGQCDVPGADPTVQALLRFAVEWEKKPFIKDKTLPVFLEYLAVFEEGGGMIPLLSDDQVTQAARHTPDAVQLMTIHGAKGLEFSYVWLLRVVSPSFPSQYRESLFEFPVKLRSSIAVGEGKEINEQEERRLFYVAITRARDRLAIGSRPGRGQDPTPPGFLRPLLQNKSLQGVLENREVARSKAGRLPEPAPSAIGSWMLMAPVFKVDELKLSANAVESYSTCPLKFKLERDWEIPGETAAALQYGTAVHTVLKHYYDPQPGRPEQSAEDVVAAFQREFAKAVIDDPVQRRLYEEQGARHLEEMVRTRPRSSLNVVGTEASFNFTLGRLKVVGRIDRLDRVQGNTVRIVDYKTGAPKTTKQADESLQLSIYAMGAAEMNYSARELVFLNVNGNEEVVTSRSTSQLERARMKIEDAAQGIAAREFGPRPGLHCRWCEFEKLCPATEQRVLIPIEVKA